MLSLSLDITELVDFLDKWLLQTWQVLNQRFLRYNCALLYYFIDEIIYIAVSENK
jgi:hypothetical protein